MYGFGVCAVDPFGLPSKTTSAEKHEKKNRVKTPVVSLSFLVVKFS